MVVIICIYSFVQLQFGMKLGGNRESVSIDSLDYWPSRVFIICLCPIAIIKTTAKQKQIITETIPQYEFLEATAVFVVLLRVIVELRDRSVTSKVGLVALLVPRLLISREKLWYVDRPMICNSGIVLEKNHRVQYTGFKRVHLLVDNWLHTVCYANAICIVFIFMQKHSHFHFLFCLSFIL